MVNGLSELSSVFHLLCWHFALANVLEPPLLSRLVRTCLHFSRIGERKGTCPKTEPYPHNSEFTLNMSTTSSCQKPQVRFYFFLILRIVIVGRCTVTFRRRPMLAHREMCNVTFNTRLLAWLFFKTIFICWPLSGSFSKCRRVLLHCSLHVLRWSLLNSIFPHCSEWPTAEWISTICRWLQWQM